MVGILLSYWGGLFSGANCLICLWYWSSQDFTNWNLKDFCKAKNIKWLVFVNIIHLTISQSDRINKWYIYLQNVGKYTSPINPIGRIYLLLTRTIDSQIEAAAVYSLASTASIPFTRGSQESKPPQFLEHINTLPETNKTSPLKSCLSQKAKDRFPTIHFHGQALAPTVSLGECIFMAGQPYPPFTYPPQK